MTMCKTYGIDLIRLFRYAKLLQQYAKEKRERKRSESKRRSSTRLSESKA
jgi:phosphopantetheinyl transferase (holo-ACP synthase)